MPPKKKKTPEHVSSSLLRGINDLNLEHIDELSKVPVDIVYNGKCIREKSNWSTPKMEYKFDKKKFNKEMFLSDYKKLSPKLNELIKKINDLDEGDMRKYGRHFKHFIFSDIKSSSYGSKMIASAFISLGKTMGNTATMIGNPDDDDEDDEEDNHGHSFGNNSSSSSSSSSSGSSTSSKSSRSSRSRSSSPSRRSRSSSRTSSRSRSSSLSGGGKAKNWTKMRLLSDEDLLKTRGNNFFLLSSVGVFDDPITVSTKKSILAKFNERPTNVYGDLARFIIMDSGFKEGIDLFDIKYIHVFEPQVTQADLTQVIGRGTRTCGQKGLVFQPNRGWPLYVFVYDLDINPELRKSFLDSTTAFNFFLKAMNFDVRLLNFSNDLEKLTIEGAVDYELTKSFSEFSIEKINSLEMIGGAENTEETLTPVKKPKRSKTKRRRLILEDSDEAVKSVEKTLTPVMRPKRKNKTKKKRKLILIDTDEELEMMSASERLKPRDIQYPSHFTHSSMKEFIDKYFIQFKWEKLKMENLCGYAGPRMSSSGSRGSTPKSMRKSSSKVNSSSMIIPEGFFATPGQLGGAGGELITLSPTQAFIKNYFTPQLPIKGMLLWQSVGTGKTCAAIATSTASFEKEGYTILWVTRTTLKNDIWKNMFDQVCHERVREEIKNGLIMPSQQSERMKLLSNSWSIRPMSYKQFSNLVSKKNILYKKLVKKNGEADPLHKTLLIIDEAHKLYGGTDLSSIERPDMNALHTALMNSYAISGNDSARVLLMTATPITNDPIELIKLVNLCRPRELQLETSFDAFSQEYLDENGFFTSHGRHKYLDDIAGYISYLNRANDPRQFSQPQIKYVTADLASKKDLKLIENFDKNFISMEHKKATIELKKQLLDAQTSIEEAKMVTDRTRYNKLFEACEKYEDSPPIKKKCETIVRSSISGLVKEAKEDFKGYREQVKELKEKIKEISNDKKLKLANLKQNIAEDEEALEKLNKTLYSIITKKCSKKLTKGKDIISELDKHPAITEANQSIENYDIAIKTLKKDMIVSFKTYAKKIADMKKLLNKKGVTEEEKQLLSATIKEEIEKFKKFKQDAKKDFIIKQSDIKESKKQFASKKKDLIKKLKKTIKNKIRDNTKEAKRQKKLDDKNAKLMRKAREVVEDIQDSKSKAYYDKYHDIIKSNLVTKIDDAFREKIEKEKYKLEQKQQKEEIKLQKQQQRAEEKERKEAEKTRKRMDKEAEMSRKKMEREAEKTRKVMDKEAEKARKKAEQEAEKAFKKAEKEREKAERAANKTRKVKK